MKQLTKKEREFYLRDVNPDQVFWVNNGAVINNLNGLVMIKNMDNVTFEHHVNNERNDFSNWINDVVGDKKLAKDIAKLKSKKAILKKISVRLRALKK